MKKTAYIRELAFYMPYRLTIPLEFQSRFRLPGTKLLLDHAYKDQNPELVSLVPVPRERRP